jgi:hypothetical protein
MKLSPNQSAFLALTFNRAIKRAVATRTLVRRTHALAARVAFNVRSILFALIDTTGIAFGSSCTDDAAAAALVVSLACAGRRLA